MNIEGKQLIIISLLAIVTNSTIYLKKYQMEKKKGKENNLGLINDDRSLLYSLYLGENLT